MVDDVAAAIAASQVRTTGIPPPPVTARPLPKNRVTRREMLVETGRRIGGWGARLWVATSREHTVIPLVDLEASCLTDFWDRGKTLEGGDGPCGTNNLRRGSRSAHVAF